MMQYDTVGFELHTNTNSMGNTRKGAITNTRKMR